MSLLFYPGSGPRSVDTVPPEKQPFSPENMAHYQHRQNEGILTFFFFFFFFFHKHHITHLILGCSTTGVWRPVLHCEPHRFHHITSFKNETNHIERLLYIILVRIKTFIYTQHTQTTPTPTVFNTNHWPMDVCPAQGHKLCPGQSLLSPTSSKDKHNQLFKTLVLARVLFFFFFFLILFSFCCFRIFWRFNSQEAQTSERRGLRDDSCSLCVFVI